MSTLYIVLFLFGTETPDACHAKAYCRGDQCEVKISTCPQLTLTQCLEATVIFPDATRRDVLGCQNKPNPKNADVAL